MNTVRTKGQPWREVEVSDAGLLDLTRRGSLLETQATTDEGATRSAQRQAVQAADKNTDKNKEG